MRIRDDEKGEMELEYKDGVREIIATDENWTAARSRIYEDDLQYGERCDARIDEESTGEFYRGSRAVRRNGKKRMANGRRRI